MQLLKRFIVWLRRTAVSIGLGARKSCTCARDGAARFIAWLRLHGPRLGVPTALANAMLFVVWLCAPHQVPVIFYKLAAIGLAGWNGYWFHRSVLPYFQPSGLLGKVWRENLGFKDGRPDFELAPGMERLFIHATWQRTAFTLAPMLAVALAL